MTYSLIDLLVNIDRCWYDDALLFVHATTNATGCHNMLNLIVQYHYNKNNDFTLVSSDNDLKAEVKHNDPVIVLDPIPTDTKYVALTGTIDSPKDIILQLFFKKEKNDNYSESNHYNYKLKKGLNEFRIMILSKYINNGLRIDFTNKTGTYTIKKLMLQALKS